MKLDRQLLSLLLKLSLGCAVTGTVVDEPAIADIGILSGMLVGGQLVLDRQNEQHQKTSNHLQQLDNSLQQELSKSQQANTKLNKELENAKAKIDKHQHQLKTQQTRQRLNLSAVQKLQHQYKLIASQVDDSQKVQQATIQTHAHTSSLQKVDYRHVQTVTQEAEPTTHVYIDGNNLKYALDELKIELDYNALRIVLTPESGQTSFKFYTGIHEILNQKQQKFLAYLRAAKYQVITLNLSQRDNQRWKTVGDDIQIAIDMVEEVKPGDRVILVSGDGDFIPVVKKIQLRNAEVAVVSKLSILNRELRAIADRFIDLEEIKYQIATHKKISVA